jgi:lipopolysaccharide/colanic/teichoic acid biosynthesis glycosyltransferase
MYEQFGEKTPARGIAANGDSSAFLLRAGELAAAGGGLLLLSPVLLICAVLIRINSTGAILFRQKRVGLNGEIFTLYKFRTMFISSEGLPITAENDPRITAIGKILRKMKLDELPQLYNVLRGEMNFVGPRPEVAELVDFDCPKWQKVLSIRPGITDPVTLEFRNEGLLLSEVEDKLTFYREVIQPYKLNGYLSYVQNKCLKTDLKIIAQTLKALLFPQTAPKKK